MPSNQVTLVWGTDPDGRKPYGVVYFDTELSAWVCAIRGTEGFWEWVKDAEALPVDCPFGAGRVHSGFLDLYQTLQAGNLPLRVFLYSLTRPVIVTGHSLGAALATMAAVDTPNCALATFAGPRVGDADFVAGALSGGLQLVRVVNVPDFVPQVPFDIHPLFCYEHIGPTLWVDSTKEADDELAAFHSLDTYLHMLDSAHPLLPQYVINANTQT